MHAVPPPRWSLVAFLVAWILFYLALGWVILKGYRWLRGIVESSHYRAFRRAYEGLKIHDSPGPGLVFVRFYTYWGFFLFTHQQEHRFWAPPVDAREALNRLHRFNLIWGFFVHFAILIPIVSFGNYLIQRRSIRKQELAEIE
jgi:hypothetical protein